MKTGLIVLAVIALIVVGGIGWAIGINNQLVGQEQAVNEKWAQVQNVYQRRADLIPNLVETVKGYAAQERTVLEEVTKARASVAGIKATPELVNDPEAFRKFQAAQQELSGALCAAARHGRAVSGSQVQPELPDAPEPARGHREPHRGGAHALQRGGARLQHPPAALPGQSGGLVPRVQGEGLLRGGTGQSGKRPR